MLGCSYGVFDTCLPNFSLELFEQHLLSSILLRVASGALSSLPIESLGTRPFLRHTHNMNAYLHTPVVCVEGGEVNVS